MDECVVCGINVVSFKKCNVCENIVCKNCAVTCNGHVTCGGAKCSRLCSSCVKVVCDSCINNCYKEHRVWQICYSCCKYRCHCLEEVCGCVRCGICSLGICADAYCKKYCAVCNMNICSLCADLHYNLHAVQKTNYIHGHSAQLRADNSSSTSNKKG